MKKIPTDDTFKPPTARRALQRSKSILSILVVAAFADQPLNLRTRFKRCNLERGARRRVGGLVCFRRELHTLRLGSAQTGDS